nr:sigma-70 family RNA polymerase sigma factor [Fulvivirga sedimenti]
MLEAFRKSGDPEILGTLYGRYMHLVYGVCLKYLKDREKSKDAVMEIFEKLNQQVLRYEIRNFKSWLHVLTKNYCLMILRSAQWKREQQAEEISEFYMESGTFMHHENGQGNESDLKALEKCIETLQNKQKTCVRLFYLEERSYREISDETEFDLKKVKSYIQNGKRNLKICMEKKREE